MTSRLLQQALPGCMLLRGHLHLPVQSLKGLKQSTKKISLCFLILVNNFLINANGRRKCVISSNGVSFDSISPSQIALQNTLNNLRKWTTANLVTSAKTRPESCTSASSPNISYHPLLSHWVPALSRFCSPLQNRRT